MSLTRRKGLGAILGGIVAGPKAATEAINHAGAAMEQIAKSTMAAKMQANKPNYPTPFADDGLKDQIGASTESPFEKAKRIKERIKRLQAVASGDFSGTHQEYELARYTLNGHSDLEACKSMSPNAKNYIMFRRSREKYITQAKEDAKRELANMMGVKEFYDFFK